MDIVVTISVRVVYLLGEDFIKLQISLDVLWGVHLTILF